jgi:hypothetical protein
MNDMIALDDNGLIATVGSSRKVGSNWVIPMKVEGTFLNVLDVFWIEL